MSSRSLVRRRFEIVFRSTRNLPVRVFPQMCVKPRKSNVSGSPRPLASRARAANRPNSISLVFSAFSSSPNLAKRSTSSEAVSLLHARAGVGQVAPRADGVVPRLPLRCRSQQAGRRRPPCRWACTAAGRPRRRFRSARRRGSAGVSEAVPRATSGCCRVCLPVVLLVRGGCLGAGRGRPGRRRQATDRRAERTLMSPQRP